MPRDVNDPSNLEARMQAQLELARDHDHPEDSRALVEWGESMYANGMASATISNRLSPMRVIAERADKPLVEFDSANEVTSLLASFKDGSHPTVSDDGLASGTLRQYRQAARLFFRDGLDREWAEDIEVGQPQPSPVTQDQLLTPDEIDQLLDTATTRDRAFLAFALVTGQRVSALLSIRVRDVDLRHRNGTITLNDDAEGLKGASGPRPMLWARPYISNWLSEHPRRDDGDAPLFCTTQSGKRPTGNGDTVAWSAGDPITPGQIRNRLRDVADDAGVPSAKLKIHNLRHTAITRMRDEGTPDDRIKFMVGVRPDSTILERYDHADDSKMLARIREEHGIHSDEKAAVGRPTIEHCQQCNTTIRSSVRFCPGCGMPFTEDAAAATRNAESGVADDMIGFSDVDARQIARTAFDELQENPEFRERVFDRMKELGHSESSSGGSP